MLQAKYISEWYLNIDTDSHTHTHTEKCCILSAGQTYSD